MFGTTGHRPAALTLALLGAVVLTSAALAQGEATLTREQGLELERALAQLNFDPGPIDGTIDQRTRAAIRLYQEFAALPSDGAATPALLEELRSVASAFKDMKATRTAEQAVPEAPPPAPPPAPEPEAAPVQDSQSAAAPAPDSVGAAEPEPVGAAQPAPDIAEAPDPLPPATAPLKAPPTPPAESETPEALPPPAAAPIDAARAKRTTPPDGAGDRPSLAPPPADTQPETAAAPAPEPEAPAKSAPVPTLEQTAVAETTPAPAPAPPIAEPTGVQEPAAPAASGFNIDSVISRLVETGEPAPAPTAPAPTAAAPAPAQAPAPAKAAAPAPAPVQQAARPPSRRIDGYAAFRDGFAAVQEGDYARAATLYTGAIDSKKLTLEHQAHAQFNRGNVHHYLRRYDDAVSDYDAAIANQPNFAAAYYNRGFAYQAMGEERRAIADFRTARDLGLQRLGVRAPDVPPP